MNSTLIKTALGILALGTLYLNASSALAGWHDHGVGPRGYAQQIDARLDRQEERIRAGKRDGSLTRAEARELLHEQRRIRAMEREFGADGVIDAREFRRLDRALDRASRTIRAERDDRQARPAPHRDHRFN